MPSVLIVDDDPSIRTTVSMLLRMEGFEVRSANDGRAALEAALAAPPDVILSDLHMPMMSGLELLAAVRGAPPLAHTRLVLLTGAADESIAPAANGAVADAVLTKPFSRDQLLATLASFKR
jgi:CheY-like chemotaxis protein